MSALSELIVPAIFVLLALFALGFLYLTFKVKRSRKPWTLLAAILSICLIFSFRSFRAEAYRYSQLDQIGVYYLTNYPGCEDCILELKEDMTYDVRNKGKILETSDWHYESGGDYWITYLDFDRHQLGSGDYAFKKYHKKYGFGK
jgi:hypothetical protein